MQFSTPYILYTALFSELWISEVCAALDASFYHYDILKTR